MKGRWTREKEGHLQPNSTDRKALRNDRQSQKSTVAETGSFTDTSALIQAESWRNRQPCREAGGHTQETDRQNRETLRHQFPRSTLPTNSSWKPPNPLHFETDAHALCYNLPLRNTHLDNSHGHTQRQPHLVTPETDIPQTPTDHSLQPHQIQHHRMKITCKPGTAKTARQQILMESLFGARHCGYNQMPQPDTESHRLFTGQSPQIFQQCPPAPDLVHLRRMNPPSPAHPALRLYSPQSPLTLEDRNAACGPDGHVDTRRLPGWPGQ